MVLVVYGFTTQTAALQFEWAWQHPERSLDTRAAAASVGRKARYGVKGKVTMLMEMLNCSPWKYYPLSVRFLRPEYAMWEGTSRGQVPAHVQVSVGSLSDLDEDVLCAGYRLVTNANAGGKGKRGKDIDSGGGGGCEGEEGNDSHVYDEDSQSIEYNDENTSTHFHAELNSQQQQPPEEKNKTKKKKNRCFICDQAATRTWTVCSGCDVRCHVGCLAEHYLVGNRTQASMPGDGGCPSCGQRSEWSDVLMRLQHAGWGHGSKRGGSGSGGINKQEEQPGSKATSAEVAQGNSATAASPRGIYSVVEEEIQGSMGMEWSQPAPWADAFPLDFEPTPTTESVGVIVDLVGNVDVVAVGVTAENVIDLVHPDDASCSSGEESITVDGEVIDLTTPPSLRMHSSRDVLYDDR